jgi:hypothetical protein
LSWLSKSLLRKIVQQGVGIAKTPITSGAKTSIIELVVEKFASENCPAGSRNLTLNLGF